MQSLKTWYPYDLENNIDKLIKIEKTPQIRNPLKSEMVLCKCVSDLRGLTVYIYVYIYSQTPQDRNAIAQDHLGFEGISDLR